MKYKDETYRENESSLAIFPIKHRKSHDLKKGTLDALMEDVSAAANLTKTKSKMFSKEIIDTNF